MPTPEILAPAGGMEQVYAAVRCGANAVYLGAKGFNARRNAENFDEVTLPRAVAYCHARNVKLFVTVNTVIMDAEREQLEEEADLIAAAGADGVIIQDMAVAELFARRYPTLRRHASTQTAVHNVSGAKFLQDMGFHRIVLARELTLSEMEQICRSISIDAEAFVHGAHCMSVSGACYLSAMLGGRSGNRGLCAQPCRLNWLCGEREYALSLKDMSLIGHIDEMARAGVASLKIEGRMKRPEYVAAAVQACKQAMAHQPYDSDSLRAVFSRSGFTDGYLTGRRDKEMFGSRTREDVVSAEGVLGSLAALYRNETPLVPVTMTFTLTAEQSQLTVQDGVNAVTVQGDAPQAAIKRELDADSACKNLSKMGGTPFYPTDIQTRIDPGLMLPAAGLNDLRRRALSELLEIRSRITPHVPRPVEPEAISVPVGAEKVPALWGRFERAEQIPEQAQLTKILLPVAEITPALIQAFPRQLVGELPALLFPDHEEALIRRLTALRQSGLKELLTDNIYGIYLAKQLGFAVHGGAGLNILNTTALRFYEKQGLQSALVSFELAMAKGKALGGSLPRGIVSYGRLPLMRMRNCPVKASVGCGVCGGCGELTDRKGVSFPVQCSQKRYVTLLNSVPLHIAERDLSGWDHQLLFFTTETADQCRQVIWDYQHKEKAAGERTGGLYYRELL